MPRRALVLLLQVAASLAVLALLLREARLEEVLAALGRVALPWLAASLVVRTAALVLHEVRVWAMLRADRCLLHRVMGIGFFSGLINTLVPVRLGDLCAVALLTRELRVPWPRATSTVALVALLEAAALGLVLLAAAGCSLLWWEQTLGVAASHGAISAVATLTLGGVGLVLLLALAGRLARGRERGGSEPAGPGLLRGLRLALAHAGEELGRAPNLLLGAGLALVDMGLFLLSYELLLRALGLSLEAPWFAASAVLALGVLSSFVLPPGLGAGTAASSVAGLGLLGIGEGEALAFAALVWLSGSLPALVLGLPPALARAGQLGALSALAFRRGPGSAPPTG